MRKIINHLIRYLVHNMDRTLLRKTRHTGRAGHGKPDNAERTHEAGVDAQGVEAQSVECLLSMYQALGS